MMPYLFHDNDSDQAEVTPAHANVIYTTSIAAPGSTMITPSAMLLQRCFYNDERRPDIRYQNKSCQCCGYFAPNCRAIWWWLLPPVNIIIIVTLVQGLEREGSAINLDIHVKWKNLNGNNCTIDDK